MTRRHTPLSTAAVVVPAQSPEVGGVGAPLGTTPPPRAFSSRFSPLSSCTSCWMVSHTLSPVRLLHPLSSWVAELDKLDLCLRHGNADVCRFGPIVEETLPKHHPGGRPQYCGSELLRPASAYRGLSERRLRPDSQPKPLIQNLLGNRMPEFPDLRLGHGTGTHGAPLGTLGQIRVEVLRGQFNMGTGEGTALLCQNAGEEAEHAIRGSVMRRSLVKSQVRRRLRTIIP